MSRRRKPLNPDFLPLSQEIRERSGAELGGVDLRATPCGTASCRTTLPTTSSSLSLMQYRDYRGHMTRIHCAVAAFALITTVGCTQRSASTTDAVTPAGARAIAKDAYTYGYPMVDSYRILHAYFVNRVNREYKAPW